MGTGNFYNKNANKIFACELRDEFDYDCLIDNIRSRFREEEKKGVLTYYKEDHYEKDSDRSYCGKVIASIRMCDKHYKLTDVSIEVDIIVRSGYYEGVNLDWEAVVVLDNDKINHDEEVEVYGYGSDKEDAYYTTLIKRYAEKALAKAIALVETVFEESSTPLKVKARFSNGETWYEEA